MGESGILSTQLVDYKLFIENYPKTIGHYVLNTALEPGLENLWFILDVSDLELFIVKTKVFFSK